MDKDFYKALFNQPAALGVLMLMVGIVLLVLPDSLAALGITLRNWVENIILFMGAFMTIWGFMDAIGGEIFFAVINSFKAGMERERAKQRAKKEAEKTD